MSETWHDSLKAIGGRHGLVRADLVELNESVSRVWGLMRDGAWHGPDEICEAAGSNGVPAREGLRRLRALRKLFEVETKRVGDGRVFHYRIKGELVRHRGHRSKHPPGEGQGEMFAKPKPFGDPG